MDLRIFTEPQQGASYDQLLAVARTAEDVRLRRVLPVGPLPGDGRRGRPARPDRRLDHVGRPGARDVQDPARHADDRGDVPAARRAGDPGGPGGRDERWPGRAAVWAQGGSRPSTRRTASAFPPVRERFDRLEEQLAIITGLWRTPLGERFSYAGHALPADRLPRPAQAGAVTAPCRSSSAAAVRAARRPWPPPTPTSSTCRSPSVAATQAQFGGSAAACTAAGRDRASLVLSADAGGVLRPGRHEVRRRAEAIGRDPDELRANGLAGSPAEVVDKIGRYAEIGASRIYLPAARPRRPRPPAPDRRPGAEAGAKGGPADGHDGRPASTTEAEVGRPLRGERKSTYRRPERGTD